MLPACLHSFERLSGSDGSNQSAAVRAPASSLTAITPAPAEILLRRPQRTQTELLKLQNFEDKAKLFGSKLSHRHRSPDRRCGREFFVAILGRCEGDFAFAKRACRCSVDTKNIRIAAGDGDGQLGT